MDDAVKRPYNSRRRAEKAQENRERIIRAATELFVRHGYGQTTIAEVAEAAGASAETVYKAFGNKAALLRSAWHTMFRGDERNVPLYDRPEMQAILGIADLGARIEAHARFVTANNRRSAPLLRVIEGAAGGDDGARAMLAEWKDRLADVAARYARSAEETGQLVFPAAECADVVYATMDGALWQRLVAERGWDDERFAGWLAEQWRRQFLG
ncbi:MULTISPECIES: TetR/AcrR family transcriptional regulator [Arthrobacter]|uniref:Helix-turn-helix domain-containing protein n=2 Tax=Arthrobacter TaxID=1663 RepID=A0ABU9KP94_9MICC|nr:TetR/AcrR family transcriptional regulator [Arthrobacter sp. YJM1]MDP5227938.1 helix-turn-helix domain-containing protein [Arthrobacter sp. YJM1]